MRREGGTNGQTEGGKEGGKEGRREGGGWLLYHVIISP